MLPGGEGGGEQGHGEPARDEEDASRSSPPPPPLLPGLVVVSVESEEENKKKLDHEQPEVNFPEDILMEILSRVPYRSLCRFKCVSRPWLALCSDRGVRKRSPQTLSGFFHWSRGWRFQNLSGKGPPMADPDLRFFRGTYKQFTVQQCSTSLLLCRCWKSSCPRQIGWNLFAQGGSGKSVRWPEFNQFQYVVCNPATKEWILLPPIELRNHADSRPSRFSHGKYFLGFDPAIPSHFVVFVPLISDYGLPMAMIYSSETGGWTSMQGRCDDLNTHWFAYSECTFLNGIMHLSTHLSIVIVDIKGNAWRKIKAPPATVANDSTHLAIGQSQGRLYAWSIDYQDCQLYIWVLDNYDSGQWNLKCTANCLELFGKDSYKAGEYYRIFAFHPNCDLIFLSDRKDKALSYDMTNQKVHVISASGDFLGGLPYIPCFAEWKSDGH